jgi:hypothetical protein
VGLDWIPFVQKVDSVEEEIIRYLLIGLHLLFISGSPTHEGSTGAPHLFSFFSKNPAEHFIAILPPLKNLIS